MEFFEDLEKHNVSIEEIEMSMFHGEIRKIKDPLYQQEKDYFQEEVAQFGESILRCMRKKNLKRFCVNFQVIQPCDDTTVNFSKTVVSKIVQVFEVLARELILEDLNMNIDISTSELVNLLAAITPCFSLKKLGLLRLSSEAVGFRALAALVTQGRLHELEVASRVLSCHDPMPQVSLNVTKYWRRLASSIKQQHGIGSVEMFQDPLQNLGCQAFENTMEGSVRMDGEEETKEAEDRLASITEEVKKVLAGSKVLWQLYIVECVVFSLCAGNCRPIPWSFGHGAWRGVDQQRSPDRGGAAGGAGWLPAPPPSRHHLPPAKVQWPRRPGQWLPLPLPSPSG